MPMARLPEKYVFEYSSVTFVGVGYTRIYSYYPPALATIVHNFRFAVADNYMI